MPMQSSVLTTQAELFEEIRARITEQIGEFSVPNTCFIVVDPSEFTPSQRQTLCATISPHSGDFEQGIFTGAGIDGVVEQSGFTVTVWSQMRLDRHDEKTESMLDAARGLFPLKRKILKALAGWMPVDDAGASLLVEYIAPISAGFPQVAPDGYCTMSLAFSLAWNWDLT